MEPWLYGTRTFQFANHWYQQGVRAWWRGCTFAALATADEAVFGSPAGAESDDQPRPRQPDCGSNQNDRGQRARQQVA